MTTTLPFLLLAAATAAPSPSPSPWQSLSLEAEMRRVQPVEGGEPQDVSGEVTVDLRWPDGYLKVESFAPFPGAPEVRIGTGLDGQEAWRAPLGNPGGPNVVIRVAEPPGPNAAESLLRRARGEMLRLLLVSFGSATDDAGLTFKPAGVAEAPEGRADRVEVSDAQGAVGTLFVDQATRRPLFISFQTTAPRIQTQRVHREPGQERPALPERAVASAPVPEVEGRLFASDWKDVGGVLLPHRLAQEIDGGTREEWTVTRWRLRPEFKADHFRRRK